MKMSRRARRMARHRRRQRVPGLNLVSLMDIFTILVFFLLVNSSTAVQLPSARDFKLPISSAEKIPEETLTLMITTRDLLVQGRRVASVNEILADAAPTIPALEKELKFQAGKRLLAGDDENQQGRHITIMGDQAIPYRLLKKIMATCTAADYRNIALAVSRKPPTRVAAGS